MLRILMFNRVVFGWRINLGMLRLMLPLILGRRHQYEDLIDARRRLLKVRSHW